MGLLAGAAAFRCDPAFAGPVGAALDRPAVLAREPAKAVVLGAAQAGSRLVVVGERGSVLLSDDGGAHWRQAAVPVSVTLTAVRFVDAQRGFAVGHGGVVLATTDGGQTWTKRLDGLQSAQIALKAAQSGGDAKAIREAERLVADGADKPLLDLHFFDASHGIVVGAYNLAFATDDGGLSWRSLMAVIDNPKALHLYTLRARGDVLLLAGEQGLALRSDDRGRSFRRLALPYKGSFFTAEMLDDGGHDLVLAGLRGNVWRSLDGGANWAQWALPTPASITGSALRPVSALALATAAPLSGTAQATGHAVGAGLTAAGAAPGLLLVNQAGQVLQAAGERWALWPGAPLPPLNGVLPLADGGVLALSAAGPLRTGGGVR